MPTASVHRYSTFATQNRRLLFVAAWLAASTFLWIALRRVDWSMLLRVLAHARLGWVAAAILLNALVLPVWSAGWYTLWPDASLGRSTSRPSRLTLLELNALVSTLGNTVPFMLGATTTIAMLAKRGRLGTKGAVTLMAFDQVLEGLTKIVLFGVVALTVPLPDWMSRGILLVCLAVAAVIVAAALAYRGMRRQLVLPVPVSVARGATSLVCFLGIKALEMLAIVAVQRSLGLSLGLTSALFILTVVLLGTIVPVAPASLGPYELAAFAGYRYLGVQPDVCAALALLQHACFLIPAVGTGYVFLAARAIVPRSGTDERSR